MGNGIGKFAVCFTGDGEFRRKRDIAVFISDPLDEGLGHSFCYVRPDPFRLSSSKVHSEEESTTFRTISGASISANTTTPLSTSFVDPYSYNNLDRASAFESSTSFASIPLQPIPKSGQFTNSGPLSGNFCSGPVERGFLSGPIERGFMSGPIDKGSSEFQRSLSLGRFALRSKSRKGALIRGLKRAISKTISRGQNSIVAPIKGVVSIKAEENLNFGSVNLSSGGSIDEAELLESQNLEWAQGKAGEDRVHVVVSEEHGWVFVGIYDGFNGPDAPDFLLSNLYSAVQKELKGLLWEDKSECVPNITPDASSQITNFDINVDNDLSRNRSSDSCSPSFEQENVIPHLNSVRKYGKNSKSRYRGVSRKWDDNQRWKCEWGRERLELDRRLKEYFDQSSSNKFDGVNHSDVLKALSRALKKTEETYLETADKMLDENPELALMGSCVLVMLMKGEDVYLMNVGDSRAVLARKHEPDTWLAKITQDLERINEETLNDLESLDGDDSNIVATLNAVQLTVDHSTSVEEVNY